MGQGLTWGSEVVVHDAGMDAVLVEVGSEPVLVLRPSMSFGAAVQAVMGVAPHMSADDAARLVRRAMPDAPNLDDLLDFPAASCGCPPATEPTPEPERAPSLARAMRGRVLRAVGGLSAAAVFGFGTAHLLHLDASMDSLRAEVSANTDARAPQLAAHTPTPQTVVATAAAPTAAQLDATRRAVERVLTAREGAHRGRDGKHHARAQDEARDPGAETPVRGSQPQPAPATATTSSSDTTTPVGDAPVTSQEAQAIVEALLDSLATPPRQRERAHHGPAEDAGAQPAVKDAAPSKPDPVKAPPKPETATVKSEMVSVKEVAVQPEPVVPEVDPGEVAQVEAAMQPSSVPAEVAPSAVEEVAVEPVEPTAAAVEPTLNQDQP